MEFSGKFSSSQGKQSPGFSVEVSFDIGREQDTWEAEVIGDVAGKILVKKSQKMSKPWMSAPGCALRAGDQANRGESTAQAPHW